jgi:hypothetical protein
MALDPNQAASTRRIAARALFLLLPLVVVAIGAPLVVANVRASRELATAAAAAASVAGDPAAQKLPAGEEPPARPRESPTPEEIEKAFAAEKALKDAERGWQRVELLAPGVPAVPGKETTAPFQGFGLSLESEPDGASVTVDGRALGETPLLAGLRCEPGALVRIRVARAPFPPRDLTTLCRADTLVKLRVRLTPR